MRTIIMSLKDAQTQNAGNTNYEIKMNEQTARQLAEILDSVEADLVGLQAKVYRVRLALEKEVGHPVGYQYKQPNERGITQRTRP